MCATYYSILFEKPHWRYSTAATPSVSQVTIQLLCTVVVVTLVLLCSAPANLNNLENENKKQGKQDPTLPCSTRIKQ
jgi:hypothetical protein